MDPHDLDDALRAAADAQPSVLPALDRVRRRARRRRLVPVVVGAVAVLAVLGATLAFRSSDTTTDLTVAGPVDPTTLDAPAPAAPAGATAACFPELDRSPQPEQADTATVAGWPATARPLLTLSETGEIWVVADGEATRWASAIGDGGPGYLDAGLLPDGTVLASRVDGAGSAVVLDRLTAPGQVDEAARLPFTTNPDAPDGVCDIDGYLASFVVGGDTVVLATHTSGPVGHSCPPIGDDGSTGTTDPWRCQSKETTAFEYRDPARIDTVGQPGNTSMGGSSPDVLASASARSRAYAYVTGTGEGAPDGLRSVTVEVPGGTPECCFGGQAGTSFALSPDGTQIAWSASPTEVRIDDLLRAAGTEERVLGTTPRAITALAWSDAWLAVAVDGGVVLVSPVDGSVIDLGGAPSSVRAVAWGF